MSGPDEEFTAEERSLAVRLFGALYFFSLGLNVAVIFSIAYAGYLGWPPLLVIPVGALTMVFARVLKRFCLRNFRQFSEEVTLGESDGTARRAPRTRRVQFTPKLIALFVVVMTAVSALWFGLGVGLRWALGG